MGEDILISHVELFKGKYPERFQVFGGVNWEKWSEMGDSFPDWVASRMHAQVSIGAQGLKIWKNFGLRIRDHKSNLVKIDDDRLDPIWKTAAALKLPVMIHIADPVAFFEPVDETNERWEELSANPDWQFTSPPYPSFTDTIQDFANLVKRNTQTIFIGAHVGCYAENLAWVADLIGHLSQFFH